MGMYDNLKIDKSLLPISELLKSKIKSDDQWQTKDLHCIMSIAEITNDGKLMFRFAVLKLIFQ